MREPNRLYKFYTQLRDIHLIYPDLRMGQFLNIIFSYIEKEKKKDVFQIEDNEFMKYVNDWYKSRITDLTPRTEGDLN